MLDPFFMPLATLDEISAGGMSGEARSHQAQESVSVSGRKVSDMRLLSENHDNGALHHFRSASWGRVIYLVWG